ncbi:MAG: GNAT family N-acetyltransferase [Anaerolineae bacterium]|nr:GNAT family N-acetyltransferase [Anaerolineae bacterium]
MWTVNGGYTIRPVRDDELEAILEVYRQCEDFLALTPQPTASVAMVQMDLKHSRENYGLFCGIYDAPDGTMVGVLDVTMSGFEGNPHHAFIALLMIGKPYRSGGLGAAVVEAAEQQMMANPDVTAILSGVMANNPGAIRFWARHGYVITAGPISQADGTTTWDLCKPLVRKDPHKV